MAFLRHLILVVLFMHCFISCESFGNLFGCFIEEQTCLRNPELVCDSGICLGVSEKALPAITCVYECEEIDPGVNNGTTIDASNVTTDVVTSDPNVTTTLATTTLHWSDDPTFCSERFYCVNGGNCSEEVNKTNLLQSVLKCDCPTGYIGLRCETECSLECPGNASCVNVGGDQYCTCPFGTDFDDGCKPTTPSPVTAVESTSQPIWFIPVIAVFALLAITLSAYFILLKLRWRSLLVTKIFHFLQPYEDDDGKIFDAFISFKSSNNDPLYSQSEDEKFVVQTLFPKLEKELNYRVCVHFRDFIPGESIHDNILWAVENSRRTILVLSPLYLQSEWARREYQKAQEEMLSLRHKIIPIIFEDISDVKIEDPNLKQILSSVTYIEYPKESDTNASKQFWSMLQLALPKIRNTDNELGLTPRTSTTGTPSESSERDSIDKPVNIAEEPHEKKHSTNTESLDVSKVRPEVKETKLDNAITDLKNTNEINDSKRKHEDMGVNAQKYMTVLEPEYEISKL